MLVEVAETSAEYDREVKVSLYTQARVAEARLVDLVEECVEIYRNPSPQGYGETRRRWRGQSLAPHAFPGLDVAVDAILS